MKPFSPYKPSFCSTAHATTDEIGDDLVGPVQKVQWSEQLLLKELLQKTKAPKGTKRSEIE